MTTSTRYRLTQYAHGGGCACKIPPGELEETLVRAGRHGPAPDLLVGLDTGDDAAVVRIGRDRAIVATTDFFTPVVDDAYDFGRIAAANALSDVYAMGGRPVVALNLVGWPRDVLPLELLREVSGAAWTSRARRGCHLAGGHSIDDPGTEVRARRDRPGRPGPAAAQRRGPPRATDQPDEAARHRCAQQPSQGHWRGVPAGDRDHDRAQRGASAAALAAGVRAATDVTGFGLLGHVYKLARASGVRSRWMRPRCRISMALGRPCATGSSAAAPAATSPGCDRTCAGASRRRAVAARRRADERRSARCRRDPGRAGDRRDAACGVCSLIVALTLTSEDDAMKRRNRSVGAGLAPALALRWGSA